MTTPLIDEELEKKAKEYAKQWPVMQVNSYESFIAGACYQAEKMQGEIDKLRAQVEDLEGAMDVWEMGGL